MSIYKSTPGRTTEYKKEEIKDTDGKCDRCGKIAILGNGLCVKCWGKQTNKMSYRSM